MLEADELSDDEFAKRNPRREFRYRSKCGRDTWGFCLTNYLAVDDNREVREAGVVVKFLPSGRKIGRLLAASPDVLLKTDREIENYLIRRNISPTDLEYYDGDPWAVLKLR